MKKNIFLTIVCLPLLILFSGGCASMFQRPVVHTIMKPEEFGREYSPLELKGDLNMLMETLDAVHPNLYAYSSKSQIDSLRHIVEQGLTTPMTRMEFYFKAAPLLARIGDGHTNLGAPWEEYAHFRSQQGGLGFPTNIAYDTLSGMTISRNYSRDSVIAVGQRIVSINGCSVDSLFAFYMRGFSGERLVFRQERGPSDLSGCFSGSTTFVPLYDLLLQRVGSREQIARRVGGVTLRDLIKTDSLLAMGRTTLPDYRFERLQNHIGYIDFRSMAGLEEFRKFLSATFADIRANPVRGLIIDLRSNGGGSSQLGSELLSFLTDSSYRMAERKEWRMSSQYKAYMRQWIPWWIRWFPFTWVSADARRYLGAEDGEIVIERISVEPPAANPLRYRGKTCFLIGPKTFSSAMMLANAVADYKLATLLGEETGGIPTVYGEVYSFDLANTKLMAGVSSAFFVRANGNTKDRRGILPDIEVRQTEEDTHLGRDWDLDRARQWILK